MAKTKRNIGLEILEGIREIKRGEHGRAPSGVARTLLLIAQKNPRALLEVA